MTASAPRVRVLMRRLFVVWDGSAGGLWHGALVVYKPPDLAWLRGARRVFAILPIGDLSNAARTWLICHDKSASARGRTIDGGHDARVRPGGARPPRRDSGGAARDRAGRGRDRQSRRNDPLRVRRPDGVSPAADGGGAARYHRTGLAGSEILL